MINQSWLDKKLSVIGQQQERISNEVIEVIAKRLNDIGTMLPTDVYALQQLYRTGADVREINALIALGTALQVKEIKKIIQEVARDLYVDAKPYYDYRKKPFIPYKDNKVLQAKVNAIAKTTQETFKNLSNSRATGFTVLDKKTGKLVFMDVRQTYQTVIDNAIFNLALNVGNYKTEIRKALSQLVDSGLQTVYWDSGYHQRLETAVRRNILDGVKKVSIEVDKQIGKEIGADGIEISVHFMSAPDHEPIQGHCFTNENFDKLQNGEDFEDINHNKFTGIRRAIGEWNCRHYTSSVVLATYKPVYSQEELDKYKKDNAEGYTTEDGTHYTLYECTQIQRQMETDIRRLKDEWLACNEIGDKDSMMSIKGQIAEKVEEYKLFCHECGLAPRGENLVVIGYK